MPSSVRHCLVSIGLALSVAAASGCEIEPTGCYANVLELRLEGANGQTIDAFVGALEYDPGQRLEISCTPDEADPGEFCCDSSAPFTHRPCSWNGRLQLEPSPRPHTLGIDLTTADGRRVVGSAELGWNPQVDDGMVRRDCHRAELEIVF